MKTKHVRVRLDFVFEMKREIDSVPHDLSTVVLMACQGYSGLPKALLKRGVVCMLAGAVHSMELDFRRHRSKKGPAPIGVRQVRRRHSASSQVKCEICAPLRCRKARP